MYDAIVVGLGGVGSAALYHLARQGARVLGLDQHPPDHHKGSSHGHSRVIRRAYFEHPDYVPLLNRAYEHWAALSALSQQELLLPVGVLQVGPPEGEVMQGVLQSAQTHGLAVEQLTGAQVQDRFPGFIVPAHHEAVLEKQAGVLRVETCVQVMLQAALDAGAVAQRPAEVTGWTPEAHGVTVQTGAGAMKARHLVLSPGAYYRDLLGGLDLPLHVLGKTQLWFEARPELQVSAGCPAFLFEGDEGIFYGLPAFDGRGVKLAQHDGGERLDAPNAWARPVPAQEVDAVQAFRRRAIPSLGAHIIDQQRCMYTCTPDGHFIVDRHPACASVSFAVGLSGHGFKMVPSLGEALADLALHGETALPISLFSAGRAALQV